MTREIVKVQNKKKLIKYKKVINSSKDKAIENKILVLSVFLEVFYLKRKNYLNNALQESETSGLFSCYQKMFDFIEKCLTRCKTCV